MAYFANSTEGSAFDEQCARCKYGEAPCPIALVQINYNYEACNNKTASDILNDLVSINGECAMFKQFKNDFEIDTSCEQMDLGL